MVLVVVYYGVDYEVNVILGCGVVCNYDGFVVDILF